MSGDKSSYDAGSGFTSNGSAGSSSLSGGTGPGTSNSISAKGGNTFNPLLYILIPALGSPFFISSEKTSSPETSVATQKP